MAATSRVKRSQPVLAIIAGRSVDAGFKARLLALDRDCCYRGQRGGGCAYRPLCAGRADAAGRSAGMLSARSISGLPVWALVMLREHWSQGAAIVGALFVAVWTADTGALLFGRLIGGPKLAPDLSPNKTWAGFLGGTAAGHMPRRSMSACLVAMCPRAVAFGIFLALAGHCGDLFESWVKRQFRAKNTGRLIPGHGGMLDRIDSLLFAAPALRRPAFLSSGVNPCSGIVP